MKINSKIFTNAVSFMGFVTFPIWLFFVRVYLPESARYDFVQNKDEFTSIMAFVVVCLFFCIHFLISIFLSPFAIENRKFKIETKNAFIKILIFLGLILNFLPLILFVLYLLYLLWLY